MGVTMHYTQYLYLTTRVNKLRVENFENDAKKIKNKLFLFYVYNNHLRINNDFFFFNGQT